MSRVDSADDLVAKYPSLFSDILGKSNTLIKHLIKEDVHSVAQPYRRILLMLQKKLEEHLEEFIS